MKLEIKDHLHEKTYWVEGDNISVEQQLRDLFPHVAMLAKPGDLPYLIGVVDRLHGFTVAAEGYKPKFYEGINHYPTRAQVDDYDPWPREGDDPETMNNVRLRGDDVKK